MTKLSLFLGCIIPNRYPGIEKATKFCLDKLGIDCNDLKGASCCPAPGVFRSFDKTTWIALASRNIALSEELGRDVLTVCNGCYGSLADANHELKKDATLKKSTNAHLEKIGKEFKGTADVRHIVEFLYDELGPENIKEMVVNPLKLRVALHYGCHLVKPSNERNLGSVERPDFFDELIEAIGAESVDYSDKMACCGAGGGVRSGLHGTSLEMVNHKLSRIQEADVDCIVNACPFCHLQFDGGQVEIKDILGIDYSIPVLHYSQLLGLALGFSSQEMGIDLNQIKNNEFIEKLKKLTED
ncbi:MAG: CoB--CoM heterodisulfide reductase subunit B [Methanosarcinaceae archaeon]|nr:CoB--CoM heterodisulfide reductase subunit B [Methanosarcinaceae archaeon]